MKALNGGSRKYGAKLGRVEFWEVAAYPDSIVARAEEAWNELEPWLESGPPVEIPFAPLIAKGLPAIAPLSKDLWKYAPAWTGHGLEFVLDLVRAHTLVHRANRTVEDGVVKAEPGDYLAVYELLRGVFEPGAEAALPQEVRELVELVEELSVTTGGPVTESALVRRSRLPKSEVHRRVEQAIELDYLRDLEDRSGRPSRLLPEGNHVLPNPEEFEKLLRSGTTRKKKR
jgi:hypothetical protein